MTAVSEVSIGNVLTRTTGYLKTVSSHSLQPYRGCTYGRSLCGVGCYVQHNGHLLKGRPWGGFLEVRTNADESYLRHAERERRWARRQPLAQFSIFLSSSTDPFVPQERRYRITESLLRAMLNEPPDVLILQTHSHRVEESIELLTELATHTELRVHVSIETDLESIPGLPPHASPVERRMQACHRLKSAGLRTVVTVSPLLPLGDSRGFLQRISEVADAVVIDHFIEGDGSATGARTFRTPLPEAIAAVSADAVTLEYRDRIVSLATEILPGRVGVGSTGFAGELL